MVKKKKYSVSLVYKSIIDNKIKFILEASIVKAISSEEALGMAISKHSFELQDYTLFMKVILKIQNN